jgi:hypothetical protein
MCFGPHAKFGEVRSIAAIGRQAKIAEQAYRTNLRIFAPLSVRLRRPVALPSRRLRPLPAPGRGSEPESKRAPLVGALLHVSNFIGVFRPPALAAAIPLGRDGLTGPATIGMQSPVSYRCWPPNSIRSFGAAIVSLTCHRSGWSLLSDHNRPLLFKNRRPRSEACQCPAAVRADWRPRTPP